MNRTRLGIVAVTAMLALPALAWSARPTPEEIKALHQAAFTEADANHDGALSPDEFATFREIIQRNRAANMFQRADANGDGSVTLEELQAMPRPGHRGCR